jgi:peptide/nickel transport system permease protein
MGVFVVRRLGQAVPVLFGISILLFFLMHAMPGGPLAAFEHQPGITRQDLARIAASYGVNQPVIVQYWDWLKNALQGNFGYSYAYAQPAAQMMLQRLPATVELMVASFALSVALSFLLGVFSAMRQYSVWDYGVTVLSYFGMSMPTFFLGILTIILFAVDLHWFPTGGMVTVGAPYSLGDRLWHLALPATVLAFYTLASESRYVRSSMLEVVNADYIRTARAKGISERRVIWRHALRNALLPVVTVMILDGAILLGGALVTETIFSWPGMGRLFYQSISQGDYPVMMVIVSFLSVVIVLANIVADVLYGVLDPRVVYS